MRKLFAAVLAAGVGLAPVAMPAASAADDQASRLGRFTTPFREDGAAFNPQTGKMEGTPRGDTGCLAPDANGHRDCLPAGASQNVLADGRVLYWNAIEGAEDLDDPMEAAVPSGGDLARNDRSRVLSINWADPLKSTWLEPENSTGYFPGTPTEPPLIPGTSNENSNEDINSDGSLFCSDQKQLADGTILAAGGTNYYSEPKIPGGPGVIELEGVRNARVFDPATNTWNKTGDMNHGRWYPSMVTLADGQVFVAGGVTKLIKPVYPTHMEDSGDNVRPTETYDPAKGEWTDNGEAAERSLPLFPRLHLLPNGHVYYDAAGQAYNPQGQSYREALWNIAATYNPATKSWTDLGIPGLGNGSMDGITPVNDRHQYAEPGFRGSTFSQALPLLPDPESNQYRKASYLTAGGVVLTTPGSYFPTDTTRINTVEVEGDSAKLTSLPADKLGRPRWYSSGVTLPTGQVLAFSGADVDEVLSPGSESPIKQVELFTPEKDGLGNYAGGTWEDVAVANRARTYHNNAVLLPDGRVLVGGHAPIPNGYHNVRTNPDLPGRPASNNYKDASFEIYEPPYLHWGVSRPVIGNMSAAVTYGQNLIVPTPDPASIDEHEGVVLVRNPSETHLIDADQRVVVLPIKDKTGDAVHVDVTTNRAALPPGPYMLFLNKKSDKGLVPSVAKQVFVGGTDVKVPGWASGADTWPEQAASSPGNGPAAGPGSGSGSDAAPGAGSAAAATARPGSGSGAALSATPVSSDRPAASTRSGVLAAVATALLVFAMLSLGGTRRRKAPVKIKQ